MPHTSLHELLNGRARKVNSGPASPTRTPLTSEVQCRVHMRQGLKLQKTHVLVLLFLFCVTVSLDKPQTSLGTA